MSTIELSNARQKWERATQPETIDYLRINGFRFFISGLPNVNYNCQEVSLPGINLGSATQNTPLVDIPLPGDKISYESLQITFIISEGLANYYEIWEWIHALGFPQSNRNFTNLKNIRKNNTVFYREGKGATNLETSDAELMILSAANNKLISVKFSDIFPVSLSSIPLTVTTESSEPATATAVFKYLSFVLETE